MKTKNFAVVIEKKLAAGWIVLFGYAKYGATIENPSPSKHGGTEDNNHGHFAHIFINDQIRQRKIWNPGDNTSYKFSRKFGTGADASRFLEQLRQHLIGLEHRIEHLEEEIAAIEV